MTWLAIFAYICSTTGLKRHKNFIVQTRILMSVDASVVFTAFKTQKLDRITVKIVKFLPVLHSIPARSSRYQKTAITKF